MNTSKSGVIFISNREGCPLTAYLDSGGVPTIGHGTTMLSKVGRAELLKLGIKRLIPGKTKLTQSQADHIFMETLKHEYEPAVKRGIPESRRVTQHMFDAMVSATYNLGPAFMGWKWKVPWAKNGDVEKSANIWASRYNTAAGRKLRGLVIRRKLEAKLFLTGDYGINSITKKVTIKAPKVRDEEVLEAQENLNKLGIKVKADGWMGPKTEEAIRVYQEKHPHLKVDGVLGVATITQLGKDVTAIKSIIKQSSVTTAVATAAASASGFPWIWVLCGVAFVSIVYFAWKYRDVVQRKFNGK